MKVFFLFLFMLSFCSGAITFFEGENEDFVMVGDTNFDDSLVYCGNAICDGDEDCGNCMRDCGVCSVDDGGYSPVQVVKDFFGSSEEEVAIDEEEVNVEEDFFVPRVVFLVGFFAMILFWGMSK